MAKLLLHITLTFICLHAAGQNRQPEQLADKLFIAFNTNNVRAYKKLMLDSADFAQFTQSTFAGKKDVQDIINTEKKQFAKQADSADTREFRRLIEEGMKLGVNWKEVKISKFIYKEDSTANSHYPSLTGYLNFTFNDKQYVIAGIDAIHFPLGYKIVSLAKVLKGKVERYFEPGWSED